jgi:hypothetical protein
VIVTRRLLREARPVPGDATGTHARTKEEHFVFAFSHDADNRTRPKKFWSLPSKKQPTQQPETRGKKHISREINCFENHEQHFAAAA